MKKLILVLLVIIAITESCKKYDEGPMFSLRSAYGRFSDVHVLTKYTVDGIDSLELYNDSLSLLFQFRYHYDDNFKRQVCLIGSTRKDGQWSELFWGWNLIDNKKIFKVYSSGGPSGTGPFGMNKLPEWEIIKLKLDDIKMKTNYNGKEYYIELESK